MAKRKPYFCLARQHAGRLEILGCSRTAAHARTALARSRADGVPGLVVVRRAALPRGVPAQLGRLAEIAGGVESLRVMPRNWWTKQAPARDRACYGTKSAALNKFREANQKVIDDYGGETARGSKGEFDAMTKYGALPATIAEALWLALPPERVNYGRGPFCLTEIDVDALNDTSPGRDHPVGFQLPDYIRDLEARKAEIEWYEREAEAA